MAAAACQCTCTSGSCLSSAATKPSASAVLGMVEQLQHRHDSKLRVFHTEVLWGDHTLVPLFIQPMIYTATTAVMTAPCGE